MNSGDEVNVALDGEKNRVEIKPGYGGYTGVSCGIKATFVNLKAFTSDINLTIT